MAKAKKTVGGSVALPLDGQTKTDHLARYQRYIHSWWTGTRTARYKMRRDFEYAEGNGKQWLEQDARKVRTTGRPVLEFNQTLPQVELMCGMQRDMTMDYVALPRGTEDRRLSEISTASLKAGMDFARVPRVTSRVFDDATICGLGIWEILHTFDDAQDLIWGDIPVSRIHPLSWVYDIWAVEPDRQDGEFMGKASWLSVDDYERRYPGESVNVGEWMGSRGLITDSQDMGLGPNLLEDLFDAQRGRVRLLTLWHKEPTSISLIADVETGQAQEVDSQDHGEQVVRQLAETVGKKAVERLTVISTDMESAIVDVETQQPVPHPVTGQPMRFVNGVMAQQALDALANAAGLPVYERMKVLTRQAKVPHVAELVWWKILSDKRTPFHDRKYPMIPYISRQFSDDPESIMGIVRNLQDPQDEFNKRYSNLLAHLNSSAHSGWLNRKTGGAKKSELELMGSRPGVTVEYTSVKPERIEPAQISEGHFRLLGFTADVMKMISGVNAELVGNTTQVTVSGRAIRARQQGGLTILKPRLRSFEEAQLDVAEMLLSRIQQYYPVEKLKRIVALADTQAPMGPTGMSIFRDPATGEPIPDDVLLQMFKAFKNTKFDLALKLMPGTATERQAQFQIGTELAGLITASGHPIGPNTMAAMMDLADMPTKLAEAMKQDLQQPANPMVAEGQNQQLMNMVAQMRGGKAGGTEGSVVG